MIRFTTTDRANRLLRGNHYLGALQYEPRFCIVSEECNAVATFSDPVSHHFKRKLTKPLELTRLWQSQGRRESGKPLSQFLAAALRAVRKQLPDSDCVFSYADPHRNHKGTIYKATHFVCLGSSRVTDYWLKRDMFGEVTRISAPQMYRIEKTKSRAALIALGYELEERPPKILYVYGLNKTPDEVRKIIGGRYAIPASEPVMTQRSSAAIGGEHV